MAELKRYQRSKFSLLAGQHARHETPAKAQEAGGSRQGFPTLKSTRATFVLVCGQISQVAQV